MKKPTLPLDASLRRSPHNNQHLTKALFVEYGGGPFSLRKKDHGTDYYSLYRLYLDKNDPTEYEFALSVLGDWEHWEILCRAPFMQEYLDKWRAELEVRSISNLYERLKNDALDESSKSSASSAKYLIDKFEKKEKKPVGRPPQNRPREEMPSIHTSFKEDFERINKKVN